MTDEESGVDLSLLDAAKQVLGVFLHVGLASLDLQTFFHHRAKRPLVEHSTINAGHGYTSAFSTSQESLSQGVAAICPRSNLLFYDIQNIVDDKAMRFHADSV